MAIVNVNSISGINSITAQSTSLNFYTAAGNTLSIGASVSGNITGNVTGNLVGNVTGNLTGNVNASGVSTFSGGIVVAAGSVSAPSISPSGDSNTGIFFPDGDTVSIGEGGTEVIRVHSLGRVLVGTANTNIAGAPSNKGAKQFIYTAEGNEEWALQARHDSTTGNGLFVRAGNNSTTYTARFTGYDENNVHLNIDGLGRVTTPLQPKAYVRKTSGQTLTTSSSKITFDAATYDVGSIYSNANDRITVPVAGYYFVSVNLNILSSTNTITIDITRNGTAIGGLNCTTVGANVRINYTISGVVSLSANDFIEVVGVMNSGSVSVDNAGFLNVYLLG